MATPSTPSNSDGGYATSLRPSVASLNKKLAAYSQSPGHSSMGSSGMSVNGSSLPTTPAKLIDLDPAIVLSIKKRDRTHDLSIERPTDHLRNISSATIMPAKPELNSGFQKIDARTKTTMLERPWRPENDPFFAAPGSSLTHATTAVESEFQKSARDDKSPTPRPREDRSVNEISSENAQGYFNAEYCVFVANLAVGCPDAELEAETERIFSRFGSLYVKIRRDRNGMPYAFCQYTTAEAAKKALENGHALMICGRPCRVERAKANREQIKENDIQLLNSKGSVYLSRTSGGDISEEQAREILVKTGHVDKFWYASDTDKEIYRLPNGIWATFSFFQDARDAQNRFKDSKEYRLEVPYSPEEHERQRTARYKFSPNNATPLRSLRAGFRWPSSSARFVGNSSIFIGNLPLSASMESIREMFETCGTVRTIEIIGKSNGAIPGLSAFAFVEFATEVGAKNALGREINFNGRRLRLEPRESQDQSSKSGSYTAGSPHPRGPITPRTPSHATETNVKSAAATAPQTPMVPIFENAQQNNVPPQTPAQQVFHHPFLYGSPYYPAGFYPGSQGEAAPPTVPAYGGPVVNQAAMGYYAYPGYYPGYNMPYTSPAQANPNGNAGPASENPAVNDGKTTEQAGPTS